MANLLLAALDSVSSARMEQYGRSVGAVGTPSELVDAATEIFRSDLDAGYITVLVEMIAGASSTPGLGAEVAARIGPWKEFAQAAIEHSLGGLALGQVLPSKDVAYAIVALYLGLEMLSHLDGDRGPALALFAHAKQLAGLFEAMTGLPPTEGDAHDRHLSTTQHSRCRERRDTGLDVVTGAFSYSGGAIARALIESGRRVRTITGHPERAGAATPPSRYGRSTSMTNWAWSSRSKGRPPSTTRTGSGSPGARSTMTWPSPTRRTLFHAARRAGVQRIVHVSITNPSIESPFPYFRGKALVERALAESEISFAVLRPAILFGGDGVLLNNIALAAAPPSRLRRRRSGRLSHQGHPHRRSGRAGPGQGRRASRQRDRRGRARTPHIPGVGRPDPRGGREPVPDRPGSGCRHPAPLASPGSGHRTTSC